MQDVSAEEINSELDKLERLLSHLRLKENIKESEK
jgi:ribosomal protein L29